MHDGPAPTPVDVELGCAAVLLGLDGVLVDAGPAVERSWRRWAARRGVPESAVLAACHGQTSTETVAAFAEDLDAAEEAARLEREQALDTAGVTRPLGAARIVAALPPAGWAVVTPLSRPLALARLRGARLPVPEVLVTAEDGREGHRLAAERLGVPAARCVAVADDRVSVAAARAAGCRVIGLAGDALGPPGGPAVVVAGLAGLTVVTPGTTAGDAITVRVRSTPGT